jgi:UDP-N-acetylmuramoyl-L-alanyl-D-glutamate--2,6-diaminopimelate ligase
MGIANADDGHFEQVLEGHTCTLETIGFSEKADYRASGVELIGRPGYLGVRYHISGKMDMDVEIDVPGTFSVYNSLVAIAVCEHFNVSADDLREALKVVKTKGRIEMVPVSKDFILMIDYAHNAMSLESLLLTLKEYHPKRLVCVFGCGGNGSGAMRWERCPGGWRT